MYFSNTQLDLESHTRKRPKPKCNQLTPKNQKVILIINTKSFYFEKVSLFINFYQNRNCFKGSFFQKLYRKSYQFKNCFLLAYTFEKKSIYHLLKIFQYDRPSIRSITNTITVKLFEKPQKKLSSKNEFLVQKAIFTNFLVANNTNNQQIKSIENSNFTRKTYLYIGNQFDLNNRLKRQILYLETISNSETISISNAYQILLSTNNEHNHYNLYQLLISKDKQLTKKEIKKIHQNAMNIINEFIKEQNYKDIEKVYFENDELKSLLIEVNSFVLTHASYKSDLKQNWKILVSKFYNIKSKLHKNDETFQIIIQSFQNVKKYNQSSMKFTKEEKKSLSINMNSVFNAINTFFDFISNDQIKSQSKNIEKKLFKVVFNPINDDSYRTNVFSVYQKHDDLIYSQKSFSTLISSTGSGKTRCAPFFFAIKTIEDDMNRPFIIMTQPRYAIIKTKINDFREIFGDSIRLVTNTKKMFSLYERFTRKDFHPKPIKPIFGLFTSQSLLELMKKVEETGVNICSITRFILDEIHERTVETDVLCAILSNKAKELIHNNKNFDLQVLLMSATPDKRIYNCFDNMNQFKLPESQLFPVETIKHEVSNKDEINSVIVSEIITIINKMGDSSIEKGHILVFTSGNSRMKKIQSKIYKKIERDCYSSYCSVKVIDKFDSLFEDENIDMFHEKLDKYIEHETKKFNFLKEKGQKILFVLPIKYLGYLSKEQKEICINPINQHPNLIKIILATNAIESSITIDNLAAVIDSGLFNHSSYNISNGLTNLDEEMISIKSQHQRKGRVGRIREGISVKITLKNKQLPELLPPEILTSDVSFNILSLRKIGYRIEDIDNLPDKIDQSEKEKYIDELVSFNALTKETHELTSLGQFLLKFKLISPFISAAILNVAGYKTEDFENCDSNEKDYETIEEKELLVLLGCFITMIFSSSDLVINKYSKKLREYFDKRSDIITLLRTVLDLAQYEKKEIRKKEDEFGLDCRLVEKILGQLQQTTENFLFSQNKENENQQYTNRIEYENKRKEEEKKKFLYWKKILQSLKEFVDDLISDDSLYIFIQMLIEEISKNKPEWIESRRVEFINIENILTEASFIYFGNKELSFSSHDDRSLIYLKMRPGAIGLDCPAKGIIFSIIHDNNSKKNTGYLIHSDYTDEDDDFVIPHPISAEVSIILNNDFSTALLNKYFNEDTKYFDYFNAGICRNVYEGNALFYRSQETIIDSNDQQHAIFSFIPTNEESITLFNNAVKIIESLIPYTASTILIQNREINCFVSLHNYGKERIDSSVHFYDDDDYFAYRLNKETIEYLHDNIDEMKIGNTLSISITGQFLSYPLNDSDEFEDQNTFSQKIIYPQCFAPYVFSDGYASHHSHLVITTTHRIVDFDNKNYLLKWVKTKEESYLTKRELEILHKANMIAKETISFKHVFNRLIFLTKDSIFQAKGRIPSSYDIENIPYQLGPIEKVFYKCALNHIEGENLTSPLQFRGFYFRGKQFPCIDEIYQIPDFKYLGNSCVAFDVQEANIDYTVNTVTTICNEKEIDIGYECLPVYSVYIKHAINSNLTKEEFIERVDSILDQFGGVIAKEFKYKKMVTKTTGYQGMIKVLIYYADFAIPLAAMINKSLGKNEVDPFTKVLSYQIDPVLFDDYIVKDILNNWCKENDLQFNQKTFQLLENKENIYQAISKFKKNPPEIPFKSYSIPDNINILQINNHLKSINRKRPNKWYLNKNTRTLYAPINVNENEVKEFMNQFENKPIKLTNNEEEDNILWELSLHDEEPSLSRQQISIYLDNGETIQRNFCVECLHESFLYNLRKMYNEEENTCSIMEMYNDDHYLNNISLLNDETNIEGKTARIPIGQMVFAFIKEPKIANQVRTWMTAVAIKCLRRSSKITFCPFHHYILLPNQKGFPISCSIPTCKYYRCVECNHWHQIGKCEKEPSLPAGTRKCPFCNEPVEKMQACNHIACRCGKDFCYYCGQGFENSNECYKHMDQEKHWEEAPDYERFIKKLSVKDEVLNEFYEKYPKLKPAWMDLENIEEEEENEF